MIDDDAVESLVKIAPGDARDILNILQALSMVSQHITNDQLYATVGLPQPRQVNTLFVTLLTDTFEQSLAAITESTRSGIALADLLRLVLPMVNESKLAARFDRKARIEFISELARIESRPSGSPPGHGWRSARTNGRRPSRLSARASCSGCTQTSDVIECVGATTQTC